MGGMQSDDLAVFLAVAEAGSIWRAAERAAAYEGVSRRDAGG